MNEIQTTDQAFLLDLEIKQHVKLIRDNFWNFVGLLEKARDNKIWLQLDCDTFASWLAQPEIDLNERTVENYISVYRTISNAIKSSHMYELPNVSIDIGKLAMIAPIVNEDNVGELLSKAEHLSRSDLRKEIFDEKNKDFIKPVLPEGKFDVIYADPPWKYDFSLDSKDDIENKYPTMEVDEICNMTIPSANNAVIFLWATAPKLREALKVMDAWGFEYKTHSIWNKDWIGMGYWFRGQHELLLVGVKGIFSPPTDVNRVTSVYTEKRTEHSKKPDYYYDLIESYFPNGKYLELFARQKHSDKWTAYGNQL